MDNSLKYLKMCKLAYEIQVRRPFIVYNDQYIIKWFEGECIWVVKQSDLQKIVGVYHETQYGNEFCGVCTIKNFLSFLEWFENIEKSEFIDFDSMEQL